MTDCVSSNANLYESTAITLFAYHSVPGKKPVTKESDYLKEQEIVRIPRAMWTGLFCLKLDEGRGAEVKDPKYEVANWTALS